MTSTVLTATGLKNAGYVAVFVASLNFIGVVPQTMVLFAALMIIDLITGIIRSATNNGCRSIKSSVARNGIVAKMLLLLTVFSIGITSALLGYDAGTYVQAAIAILSLGELYSIIGNVHSTRTGKPKVEFDAVSVILQKVKAVLDKTIAADSE